MKNNLCKCGCGNLCEKNYLRGHNSKINNPAQGRHEARKIRKDLIGRKFGRLTVIRRATNHGKRIFWLCKCTCGNIKEIGADALRSGNSNSCGCYRSEVTRKRTILPSGISMRNHKYAGYKKEAAQRGIEFNISMDQFLKLTSQNCFYCGAKPSNCSSRKYRNGEFIYQGIDRVDNAKGYLIDNVVPCCKICNNWKGKMTVGDFINHAQKIFSRILDMGTR
jgi:hypothetical protein